MTKPPYRLCWNCNRQFYGNHHRVVRVLGNPCYVHVECAKEMKEAGVVEVEK